MSMKQAGLRKERGARDQIANVSVSWTTQGSTTKMSICFIDYTKDFDSVQHLKMWNSKRTEGITQAFDSVNTRPTERVRSQVQVAYGTTEWFPIKNSTRQGCILSPGLFNLYSEYIIMTGGVGDMVTGNGKVT